MEPRRDQPKEPKPRPEVKHKRFRVVKLEERITPSAHATKVGGGGDTSGTLSIE
jgi:hypothetical protein